MPKYIESEAEWREVAKKAQERADDRREIEELKRQRLIPAYGWLDWIGLFVLVGMTIFVVLCILWLIGPIEYDPAFSGK